jgi:Fe-Mn family superoxide dismutase
MNTNSRRNFLKYSALTAGAIGISSIGFSMPEFLSVKTNSSPGTSETYPFKLPGLPYTTDELEPFIDTKTMEIHHKKHHQAYVDKLNAAMEKFPDQQSKNLETLFAQINTLPDELAKAIRNNGGGHYNHSLLWKVLTPDKTTQPSPELTKAINEAFSNMDNLKTEINKAAMGVFGSGWSWLVKDGSGKLSVIATQPGKPVNGR